MFGNLGGIFQCSFLKNLSKCFNMGDYLQISKPYNIIESEKLRFIKLTDTDICRISNK